MAAPAPAAASGLEEDDEMREVFLEEAREVMANAHEGLRELQRTPDDLEQLTLVRRSFHTLKGSSRMVGLNDFGEAAWACEQLYNAWLADQRPASEDLLGFTGEALAYLGAWVEEIAAGAQPAHQPAPVRAAADALRLEGRRVPLAADAVAPAVAAVAPAKPARTAPAQTPATRRRVVIPRNFIVVFLRSDFDSSFLMSPVPEGHRSEINATVEAL